MIISLDLYRAKLVIKILYARAGENLERNIDTAIRALERNRVNGHIISMFIEKVINQLELINSSASPDQINNTRNAKKHLIRVKESIVISAI